MTDETQQKLDDAPYQLTGHSCWYVSRMPELPLRQQTFDGKYRDTPLNLAELFSKNPDALHCEYVEFSDKYTDVVLKWYPKENRWTWDYWSEAGYTTPSENIVGEYNIGKVIRHD